MPIDITVLYGIDAGLPLIAPMIPAAMEGIGAPATRLQHRLGAGLPLPLATDGWSGWGLSLAGRLWTGARAKRGFDPHLQDPARTIRLTNRRINLEISEKILQETRIYCWKCRKIILVRYRL
jgi:hypothetical protein